MVSRYLQSEQCPICQRNGRDISKDNLAVYDDGHKYCFACGYFVPSPQTMITTKEKLTQPTEASMNGTAPTAPNPTKCLPLPADISGNLHPSAKRWLLGYGLTAEEQKKFWWSEVEQQLIYCIFDVEGRLVFWQARNFNRDRPKYISSGPLKDHLHILGHEGALLVVEDVVSAVKLSREYQSLPLFGSHITRENLIRIRDFGLGKKGELGFWLDPDKVAEAVKLRNISRELGINAFTVIGTRDPKAYNHNEIIELVEFSRRTDLGI